MIGYRQNFTRVAWADGVIYTCERGTLPGRRLPSSEVVFPDAVVDRPRYLGTIADSMLHK